MKPVAVAILGACGWMGKCHSLGYRNTPLMFPDLGAGSQDRLAGGRGRCPSGADQSRLWRRQDIERLARTAQRSRDQPRRHLPAGPPPLRGAKAALLAGKNVYCEKPFTATAEEARQLAEIAGEKGLVTRVGHNFPKNPVHDLAKEMIDNGEIGDIVLFRASMHVDVLQTRTRRSCGAATATSRRQGSSATSPRICSASSTAWSARSKNWWLMSRPSRRSAPTAKGSATACRPRRRPAPPSAR